MVLKRKPKELPSKKITLIYIPPHLLHRWKLITLFLPIKRANLIPNDLKCHLYQLPNYCMYLRTISYPFDVFVYFNA